MEDDNAYLPYEEFIEVGITEEEDVEFGKQSIEAGFFKMKKKCEKVYLNDYPN